MDLATLVGLLGAWVVMIAAIVLGASPGMFLSPPSMLIVLGGTFGAVMMKFSMAQFFGAMKVFMKALFNKLPSTDTLVEEIEEMAAIARKEGLLALEGREISDPFLEKGIQMMVDGHSPEMIRSVMEKDMQQTSERHELGASIFKGFGDYAPAMGMIGTLIGLVQMLSNMDDPKAIGPAMAVALLTTLYGAMIANMFALPAADKLGLRAADEKRIKSLIIDGLQSIQAGHNPYIIKELLATYLPPSKRKVEEE
ncbi:flagellar motor protein PomA [Ectothiorhodospiraceae bacterium BW-2]|nr:flagellar motor protein PomA [Ectothiorhodospiraceae bacterium BW-2]